MEQEPGHTNHPYFYSFLTPAGAFSVFTLETQPSESLLIFLVFPGCLSLSREVRNACQAPKQIPAHSKSPPATLAPYKDFAAIMATSRVNNLKK